MQPANNWQNFQLLPTDDNSISAVIGVTINGSDPSKLTGEWCFYVNNRGIPKIDINPNLFAFNLNMRDAKLILPIDTSEVHFQCLYNSRNSILFLNDLIFTFLLKI